MSDQFAHVEQYRPRSVRAYRYRDGMTDAPGVCVKDCEYGPPEFRQRTGEWGWPQPHIHGGYLDTASYSTTDEVHFVFDGNWIIQAGDRLLLETKDEAFRFRFEVF